jgi:hypothetical protein
VVAMTVASTMAAATTTTTEAAATVKAMAMATAAVSWAPWLKFVQFAVGARMETSDKFKGEPAKGGEFGPEMLPTATKKMVPP